MKQTLAILLTLLCALSLIACDNTVPQQTTEQPDVTFIESSTESLENFEFGYEPKTTIPLIISAERFNEKILKPLYEKYGDMLFSESPSPEISQIQNFCTYYVLFSKEALDITSEERHNAHILLGGIYDDLGASDHSLQQVINSYPIVDKMSILVFDPNASADEIASIEVWFKETFPDYTINDLCYDYYLVGYTAEPALPDELLSQPQFHYAFDMFTGTYSIIGTGTVTDSVITIPNTFNGMPVSSFNIFSYSEFSENFNPTTINIANNIPKIDTYFFSTLSNLESIVFDGTIEQWNAIDKGEFWDENPRSFTIYCTNGEIPKSQ